MKRCLWFVLMLLLLLQGTGVSAAEAETTDIRDAIVKIYSVFNQPDYYNPWNMQGPRSSTGSGAVIEGNRILTNAHVVSDVTFLQARRYGDTERYRAHVAYVSHQSDLAVVVVDDPSFFEGITPLSIGGLPETHKEVAVYGFPMGGDTLSITKGVVSRIEHQPYVHSSFGLLAGQIDAAINPGSSGGPVIVDGELVGVIMQGIPSAQSLGYMVPTPIIQHFLDGIASGNYPGFPSLGIIWQRMENPDLRSKHQMQPGQTGVLVNQTYPGSPADGKLLSGDVVLAVDDSTVANDGTVEFRSRERTSMSYVVQQYQVGDTMSVTILRDGDELTIPIELHRPADRNWLVPHEQYETQPRYFIYGGLVFTQLTKNLLQVWGSDWRSIGPTELISFYRNNIPEEEGDEVIVLLRILPDDVNTGYESAAPMVITDVNGQSVRSLQELVQAVEGQEEPFTTFQSGRGQLIVLDRASAEESRERILTSYRIAADRSDDLLP